MEEFVLACARDGMDLDSIAVGVEDMFGLSAGRAWDVVCSILGDEE